MSVEYIRLNDLLLERRSTNGLKRKAIILTHDFDLYLRRRWTEGSGKGLTIRLLQREANAMIEETGHPYRINQDMIYHHCARIFGIPYTPAENTEFEGWILRTQPDPGYER